MEPSSKLISDRFPELMANADAVIQALCESAKIVRIDTGQPIFHAGDSCDNFLLLLDGDIRVQLTSVSGREVTLYRISPGGSCVLTTSCLLGNEHYPAEAVTESNIVAALVSRAEFRRALRESDAFREFVFNGFAHRLSRVIGRIEEIAFSSIDRRLATALLALAVDGPNRITHQKLAVEIGSAREVVSRHLKRFESFGWVALGRGRVEVRAAERLREIASGEECD